MTSDLLPHKHGDEGEGSTHSVCKSRLEKEGGKATCCYCNPHKGCTIDTPHQPEDWDEEGSQKGWFFHKESCAVWKCNPRKSHENGLCDCLCTCGTKVKIKSFIASEKEASRQEGYEEGTAGKEVECFDHGEWMRDKGRQEALEECRELIVSCIENHLKELIKDRYAKDVLRIGSAELLELKIQLLTRIDEAKKEELAGNK